MFTGCWTKGCCTRQSWQPLWAPSRILMPLHTVVRMQLRAYLCIMSDKVHEAIKIASPSRCG